jgi:hypothetical protein
MKKKVGTKNGVVHLQEDDEEEDVKMYDVPDRLTGREAVDELVRLNPEREWRFVEVDVTYKVSQSEVLRCECECCLSRGSIRMFTGKSNGKREGVEFDVSE